MLWFAWKFVPLWYQQQRAIWLAICPLCCDLLENSYLCGISNNTYRKLTIVAKLWFAWKFVPLWYQQQLIYNTNMVNSSCDLLENSYLCGISNNYCSYLLYLTTVVICLKIRTFVVSATTPTQSLCVAYVLWFAWKFVPLWYQQQLLLYALLLLFRCDLLENSYLCGISNNRR